ncbi:MAG: hypothetical protein LBN95_00835 [Prevotellaceae bacterium]|nr:hypothetical protein [Prevotellaceae bacterium]
MLCSALLFSCKQPQPEPQIEVTPTTLSFSAVNDVTENVEVKNVENWDFTNDLDWLNVTREGNILMIFAVENLTSDVKEGIITVFSTTDHSNKAEIHITQQAAEVTDWNEGEARYFEKSLLVPGDYGFTYIPITAISENGLYVAGNYADSGVLFDIREIANADYVNPWYNVQTNPELDMDGSLSIKGIANDGTPFKNGVTADGNTTLKYVMLPGAITAPYVVQNGIQSPLPFPDTYTIDDLYYGAYTDYISADGKYILGRLRISGTQWQACKWELNGSDYLFSIIGENLIETAPTPYGDIYTKYLKPYFLSIDGNYSCGQLTTGQSLNSPYLYNMKTDALEILTDETDAAATCVSDDGILFCGIPNYGPEKVPFVYENGVKSTFADWVMENYGLEIANRGFVTAISKDKKVIVWVTDEIEGFKNHFIVVK